MLKKTETKRQKWERISDLRGNKIGKAIRNFDTIGRNREGYEYNEHDVERLIEYIVAEAEYLRVTLLPQSPAPRDHIYRP